MMLRIETSLKLRGYIESNIGGRLENQDSAGSVDAAIGTAVVVCDGMGGMNGGKTASEIAVKTIIDDIKEAKEDASPSELLIEAFRHAHEKILSRAKENPELEGMGTTATAIIISRKVATVAHLGDSRIYQFRGRRKVFRTTDHSAVFQLVKAGTLTEEQARLSAQSNIILKAIGVQGDITPDVEELPFYKGDRFVLCTDGFWGVFPERQFIKLVTDRGSLKENLSSLSDEINSMGLMNGGGHDNLTAAFIDVQFDSKIKPKMSKTAKCTFAIIVALLAVSVAFNIQDYKKLSRSNIKIKAATEYAKVLRDSSVSDISVTAKEDFLNAFTTDSVESNTNNK